MGTSRMVSGRSELSLKLPTHRFPGLTILSSVVHGLTTAASLWLSAAVGVACGGALYFAAVFGTAVMLVLLRFGPRMQDNHEDGESEEEQREVDKFPDGEIGYGGVEEQHKRSERTAERRGSETSSLLAGPEGRQSSKNNSMRKRAHLASLV